MQGRAIRQVADNSQDVDSKRGKVPRARRKDSMGEAPKSDSGWNQD